MVYLSSCEKGLDSLMRNPPVTIEDFQVVPGGLVAPQGFVGGGISAGIKVTGAKDLGAVLSTASPCTVAGMFTTNRVHGASVEIDRGRVANGRARGIVFNSGCSNVFTGVDGHADATEMAAAFARKHNIPQEEILVASTGVIGFRLPMPKVLAGIERLTLDSIDGITIAEAMMTTDAWAKHVAVEVPLTNGPVKIGGSVKGAGMIHPNMATMLAFVTTDAALLPENARALFRAAVNTSFNAISIDGDQSTSDTALLFANGAAGFAPIDPGVADYTTFARALNAVCQTLAKELVRNGEGVTKVMTIDVRGAPDDASARKAARTVSTSLLVKTAVHGADPNWGRVVMALGNSGVEFDPTKLDLWIGDTQIVRAGQRMTYDEPEVSAHLRLTECRIAADLHTGAGQAVAWSGDLSKEYVEINAAYMT